jgi:hypothetical protein
LAHEAGKVGVFEAFWEEVPRELGGLPDDEAVFFFLEKRLSF